MRRSAALLALVASIALAGEPATLPEKLEVAKARAKLELLLSTTWSSSDHKLRAMNDEARLEASFDVTPREGSVVEATPRSLLVSRRKHGHIKGFFSDDKPDARAEASWNQGDGSAPPVWRLVVSPRGEAVADASSASPVWHLETWLHPFDKKADEEARLRRLVHYTDLGFFGAPLLQPGERFDATFALELGQSGLTNKLVDIEATYALSVTKETDVLRVAGPLKTIKQKTPEARASRVDQWLDVAFARGGPTATGELVALFDPVKKSWREVRSTLSLEHRGKFDGGSGRATFERRLKVTWD